MKIAHVSATFPPYWAGTGNVAYHNARLMHERGHDVTVFTASTTGDHELSMPFQVRRLPPIMRIGNAPFTPQLLRELGHFDVLHLHYPYIFGGELTWLAALAHRVPYVLTYHNRLHETHRVKQHLFATYNRFAEPVLLRGAQRLLAVHREHLLSIHPQLSDDWRVVELHNGVDTQLFNRVDGAPARAALGIPPSAPVALFVGALDQAHRFKNVDGLLEAFARLASREARLVVVGDGDLRAELEQLAARLQLRDRVHFTGQRTPQQLPALYSAADVLILPSTSVESFGMVLVEAMACGTPVIASALPGVRQVVTHDHDGLLVTPGRQDELLHAMTCLLGHRDHARQLGWNAAMKARAQYGWESLAVKLEQVYHEVTTTKRPAAAPHQRPRSW